ncbi:MAG: hypothetical protein ACXWCS_07825 [Burkholderiales bacterium]
MRAGDRLPSMRQVSRAYRVSPGTASRAFHVLEDRGTIRASPRSGYFVSALPEYSERAPPTSRPSTASKRVHVRDLMFEILQATKIREAVPFGSAFPSPDLFPLPKLARPLGIAVRRLEPPTMVEHLPPGNPELRRQIARRYWETGVAATLLQRGGALASSE